MKEVHTIPIVLNEWLSAYQDTLICKVFLSLQATSHKLYVFIDFPTIVR